MFKIISVLFKHYFHFSSSHTFKICTLNWFEMNELKRIKTQSVHLGPIREAELSPDGNYIFSIGEDDGIPFVLNANTLETSTDFDLAMLSTSMMRAITSNSNGNFFVFAEDGENQINKVSWPGCNDVKNLAESTSRPNLIDVSSDGKYLAYTGEDPMVNVIDLIGDEEPIFLADNESEVLFLKFSPDNKMLVSMDNNELYVYKCDNFESIHSEKINSFKTGICWTNDNYLLVSDSKLKGTIKIYNFSQDLDAKLKIDSHKSVIVGVSISKSGLLATFDSSKNIVISRFDKYIETNELSVVASFNSGIDLEINVIFWVNNNLYIGTDDGTYNIFETVDPESTKEIPVIKQIMESDEEIEEFSDSNEEINPKGYRSLHKRKPLISSILNKSNLSDYEEEEEEEEILEKKENRKLKASSFSINEADESDYYSEENLDNKNRYKEEREEKLNESDEDNFKKLTKKFNKEDTESESDDETSETSSSDEAYIEKKERKERKLDKKFIAGGEQDYDTSSYEEEEERFDERYQFSDEIGNEEKEFYQFMPGSSNEIVNKRRFLCWNLIGTIFLRENVEEGTSIDVEFADKVKYKDKHFNNKEKFILGSISTGGIVLASRSNISFQSFQKWTSDNEFSMRFPYDETIDLVACGEDWFAAATNTLRIHIFLSSGFEIAVISVAKRLTTMLGYGNLLAIVYGEDNEYKLFDIKKRKMIANGVLPFRTSLEWIGFDQNTLYIIGKDNQLFGLIFDFGVQWTPLCDIQSKLYEKYSKFWPIGVADGCIWGIGLEGDQNTPLTVSHQKLKGFDIEPVSIDDSTKEYLFRRFEYCNAIDKEKAATKMDKELLSLFASAEEMKFYERMFQIGVEMKSNKGRMFAVQYANSKGVTEIASKLQEYYAEEETNEEEKEITDEDINNNDDKIEKEHNEIEKTESDNNVNEDNVDYNTNQTEEEHNEIEKTESDNNVNEDNVDYNTNQTKEEHNEIEKTESDNNINEDSVDDSVNQTEEEVENDNIKVEKIKSQERDSSEDDEDSVCEDSIGE